MCDSREKIIDDHYVLQQAEKRLEKRGLNGHKPEDDDTLENAQDIELLLYLGKESFINSKQSNQRSEEAKNLYEKFPSLVYLICKMPLFIIPLFMAFVLIVMRLSDPLELVRLASWFSIEMTAEAVKESTFVVFLGLLGMSGIALAGYSGNGKEKRRKNNDY